MAIKMLVFDFRETEARFFEENELENFRFKFYEESLNAETVKKIPEEIRNNTTVISVFVNSQVDAEVINEFKNLRIISTRSTGFDHICKKTAMDKNIAVINVQNYGATSVAQYTFALMLALVRNIIPAASCVKEVGDLEDNFTGRDFSKLTLGVIGTGAIGAAVCRIAKSLCMKIVAYDICIKNELIDKYNVEYLTLNQLLSTSDIVTLHLPYTGDNFFMLDEKEFDIMKKDSYLINTSRGELISLEQLYKHLTEGKIKGAALDVVACQYINFRCKDLGNALNEAPLICAKENNFMTQMAKLPNVIITPHIAYDTQDAVEYILQSTIDQIRDIIKGGNVYGVL